MSEFRYIVEKIVRTDGRQKAVGALPYMSGLVMRTALRGAGPPRLHPLRRRRETFPSARIPGV
jgi:hypothetical protein